MGVRDEVARGTTGGTRSEGRDMLGIVGRVEGSVEGKTPGMPGIGVMPGRLRGGRVARGGRDGKPAENTNLRSRSMYQG